MRRKIGAGAIVLAFAIAAAANSARAASTATITLLSEFDYPSTGASTEPHGINNNGVIVGTVVFTDGTQAGFDLTKAGKFLEAVDPSGNGLDTQAVGINDASEIDGFYENAVSSAIIGFTLTKRVYSDFSGPDGATADLIGINNADDLVGGWFPPNEAPEQAFAVLDGTFTPITNSLLANLSAAQSINNKSTVVVGDYFDASFLEHGFSYTVASGAITPINFPGGTQTVIFGNNSPGTLTGRYIDSSGVSHGLARIAGHWATYDYPGATATSLEHVNDHNVATGNYTDTSGVTHGLTFQISISSSS
jgi:uncharacterized membrane protein